MQGTRQTALQALLLLTAGCLLVVLVIERMPRSTPTALSSKFMPQDDSDEAGQLDKVYQDALKQARADTSIVGAGFELANLVPDAYAARHAAEKAQEQAARGAKKASASDLVAAPKKVVVAPKPVAAPKTAAAPARKPAAPAAPVAMSEAMAAATKADSMIDAAKDLEKAGMYLPPTVPFTRTLALHFSNAICFYVVLQQVSFLRNRPSAPHASTFSVFCVPLARSSCRTRVLLARDGNSVAHPPFHPPVPPVAAQRVFYVLTYAHEQHAMKWTQRR